VRRRRRVGRRSSVAALIVAALFAWWQQRGNQSSTPLDPSQRPAAAVESVAGEGNFDYYLLSLSWSPHHCATEGRDDPEQCGTQRRYSFIVHGLWPQHERGYPQECTGDRRVSAATVDSMRDIMPSAGLIRHEWNKHGSCSGMDERAYFQTVRAAYRNIAIPPTFSGDSVRVQTSPEAIRRDFVAVNSALSEDEFALRCDGQYLAEVRVCMDKALQPRRCGTDVRSNCRTKGVVVRPIR
jgi:ribonuclease T2